jgi:hypothetical protein
MTHNILFRYHADMTTKVLGLGLGSVKVEVLHSVGLKPDFNSHNLIKFSRPVCGCVIICPVFLLHKIEHTKHHVPCNNLSPDNLVYNDK